MKFKLQVVSSISSMFTVQVPNVTFPAIGLRVSIVRSHSDYIPPYILLRGKTTPEAPVLKHATTLWFDEYQRLWKCFRNGLWIPIPKINTKDNVVTHPIHKTVRIWTASAWKSPLWLSPVGFLRVSGTLSTCHPSNTWAQLLLERWEVLDQECLSEEEILGSLGLIMRCKEAVPVFQSIDSRGMFDKGYIPNLESAIATLKGTNNEDGSMSVYAYDGRDKFLDLQYWTGQCDNEI
jgi:hypothetical protein